MDLTALRARVQPALTQDFDTVREEFVIETGSHDPRAFVRHLRDWQLIPEDLADRLIEELSGAAHPPPASRSTPARAAEASPVAGKNRTTPSGPGPAREQTPPQGGIRVRVQRVSGESIPPIPHEEEIGVIEETISARARSAGSGRNLVEFDAVASQDEPSVDDPTTTPGETQVPRIPPADWDGSQSATEDMPYTAEQIEDPGSEEGHTTLMDWGDEGTVDPETATRIMNRDDAAVLADETLSAPVSVRGPARPAEEDDDVELFDPDTHAPDRTGPPPIDTYLQDQHDPHEDGFDPEAETVHVDQRTRITAATPPPASRRSMSRPLKASPPLPPESIPTELDMPIQRAPKQPEASTDNRAPSLPPSPSAPEPVAPAVEPEARYILGNLIADDGIAQTFEGRDTRMDRPVAIRILTADSTSNPILPLRFAAEIRVATRLTHPAIPTVFDAYGSHGYVHEPVEGPTLAMVLAEARDALGSRQPLPAHAAREPLLRRLLRVCEVAAYAHEHGVLHRDIRPDNIVIGPHGAVWLLDWGIARPLESAPSPIQFEPIEEHPKSLVGTPGYCSPEQANGNRLDERSDVYALGLVLYEILTLRPAVSGISPSAKHDRQRQGQLDPLAHAFGAPISGPLREVVQRALAVHPDDRYRSASEMADALRRAMQGESGGWLAAGGRAVGRHPVLLTLVMMCLGMGWVVAVFAVILPFLG